MNAAAGEAGNSFGISDGLNHEVDDAIHSYDGHDDVSRVSIECDFDAEVLSGSVDANVDFDLNIHAVGSLLYLWRDVDLFKDVVGQALSLHVSQYDGLNPPIDFEDQLDRFLFIPSPHKRFYRHSVLPFWRDVDGVLGGIALGDSDVGPFEERG